MAEGASRRTSRRHGGGVIGGDGCYDRASGYSMSSESVSVSLRESSNAPAREKMLGMIRLKEKLVAMGVLVETVEKLTVF